MANEDRTFHTSTTRANRARRQDLGAGQEAMDADAHDLAPSDNPQEDWGEPAGEGAQFSSTNTRRGGPTEADRGHGPKTRRHSKDEISRRT
jgi:hypothetical protein